MSLRVLLAPDSGEMVGGGHVMRCLTLAGALQARGWACSVLVGPAGRRLVAAFGPPGMAVIDLADDSPAGAGRTLAGLAPGFELTVIDNYRLAAAEEAPLRQAGVRVAVLDDLADRPHACDLLCDPSLDRRPQAYAGLVPAEAVLLTGPDYALVRPVFAAARPAAAARRDGRPVARVLVSLGLTDLGGVTGRVTEAMLPLLGDIELEVVVGSGAPSLDRLRALAGDDPRVRLHVDAPAMEQLMAGADAAIGAGGSTTWERACLGLPALTVVLAGNQRAQAHELGARGLTLAVEAASGGFEAQLRDGFTRLVGDAALRVAMSRRNMELCDGLGAARVAEALTALAAQAPRSSEGS